MRSAPEPRGPRLAVMVRDIATQPTMLLWALYILLTPVYVVPNGLPQPGDMLILVLAPVVFVGWNGRMPKQMRELIFPLLAFTAYVIVLNLFWSAAQGAWAFHLKRGFLLSPLFYIYNAVMFLVALIMAQRHGEKFIYYTVRLVSLSAMIQVGISMVYSRGLSRGVVLFNNPNQLGYYAVLSALIILIGQRRARLSAVMSALGLLACLYLALYSASKAALACIVLMIVFGLIERVRTILVAGVLTIGLLLTSNPVHDLLDKAQQRVEKKDELGFFEGRGYDRIFKHPEDLLFGAGEGNYQRYRTEAQGTHELHSSVGTLVFCYGAIGTLLLGMFIWRTVRGAPLRRMLLLMPAVAYGLSHQGLRFTLLWMLLALYVALKVPPPKPAPPPAVRPVPAPLPAPVP